MENFLLDTHTQANFHKVFRSNGNPPLDYVQASKGLQELSYNVTQSFAHISLPFRLSELAKPQIKAEHTFCKSRSAQRVGVRMMLRCHLDDPVMMRYQRVGIPPRVPSLTDEAVEQNACNHTGQVQEDVRQLP